MSIIDDLSHLCLHINSQTIYANDVHYAQDVSYADRIYLGSARDFESTSLHFLTITTGEPQPIFQQQPQPSIGLAPGLTSEPVSGNAVGSVRDEAGMD